MEIDPEALKALNFIETGNRFPSVQSTFLPSSSSVVQLHTRIFAWCLQPMKNAIIRIFPYVDKSR